MLWPSPDPTSWKVPRCPSPVPPVCKGNLATWTRTTCCSLLAVWLMEEWHGMAWHGMAHHAASGKSSWNHFWVALLEGDAPAVIYFTLPLGKNVSFFSSLQPLFLRQTVIFLLTAVSFCDSKERPFPRCWSCGCGSSSACCRAGGPLPLRGHSSCRSCVAVWHCQWTKRTG